MHFKSKIAIFLVFLGILLAPMIQRNTGLFPVRELRGQGDPPAYPVFSLRSWFSAEFQEKYTTATEQHIGFRQVLIRMKNQADYMLFRKANASGVVVGRRNYLFESDYIRSYTGRDYLGDYYWEQKFSRLARVTDTLQKLGIQLAIVLEPGKATYCPEFIPGRFARYQGESTNYSAIKEKATGRNIPLLDLNALFATSRATAPFPLFPKGGIHWSAGGMAIAADTILAFIDGNLGIPVPDLVIDRIERTDSLKETDNDLVEIMNLACKPVHLRMAYPSWYFEAPDSLKRPRVLAISDSFFFNFLNAKIPADAFANEAFWYYNQTVYPETWTVPKDTGSLNIRETVESMDLILIMVTERFYHRFDWDFTDVLYRLYFPDAAKEYRYDFMRNIVRNYIWFDDIQRQSDYSSIPLETKLLANADYLLWEADQAGKIPHDIDFYRVNIMKDPTWMKQIRGKAVINGITVDEQILRDALWLLNNQNQ
ncbi:MAG: hypothetical protein A2X22_11810 [Bacteroidetes bacterium GWF2_49_14]|nr:MAG: hypothetical protein A2X22_11810 [Bacteroidetes bacterium GWF2_49_14]HBB92951.1 hypothetical protein [Bacteroidales bacterium]